MDAPGLVPESINCHACSAPIDPAGRAAFTQVECSRCGALSVVPLQFGNLLLLNVLGIGGMGTVYKGIDLQLNRYVAVKILQPKFAGNQQFIEAFAREARSAAAINHHNVAQVYSFADYGGQYYLMMELLERGSLDDRITKTGKLPEADVLAVGAGIAAGLSAAHHRGLLHRDIKPGNILFNDDGVAKLVDFGLAGAQHEAAGPGAGVIWGTPYYIAPEKLRGHQEDFHSDMYSLGATLFHALAGRPPFDAQTAAEVLSKQATAPAFNLKTYNPAVQDFTANVIGRMLAKEPAERFATYDALIQELHQAEHLLHEKQTARALVTATGERIPLLSVIATISAVIATGVVIAFLWFNRAKLFGIETSTPPPAPPPVATNAMPVAVVPVEEVNFNKSTPWADAWSNAIAQLAQNNIQAALNECENLKQLTRGQPYHRQWVQLLEGVTLVAVGRTAEAGAVLQKANPALPAKITINNLAEPLAALLLEDLPATAMANWPSWAADFAQMLRGLKHLSAGQLDAARTDFDKYRQLTPDPSQRWAYALQPLAQQLGGEISRVPAALADLDRLQQAGKFDEALQALNAARNKLPLVGFKTQLDEREAVILKAQQAAQQKLEEAKRAAEAEAKQRLAEEQSQQHADAEVRQVQALETPLPNYDFKAARAKLDDLLPKLITPAGKQALAQRRAMLHWLVELKILLASDFARQPLDASKIVTRGAHVDGKLTGATETELTFTLQYGALTILWRDLPPATIQQLGEFYAQTGKPADRARRYLATAVFAKQFNLKFADDRSLAAKLDPSLQPEISLIFGN